MTIHPYTLIHSRRRTIALMISAEDATLVVRAPMNMSQEYIEGIIAKKISWIERTMERMRLRPQPRLTSSQVAVYKQEAQEKIPPRVLFYSQRFGLVVRSIKITSAKKRWGSCGSRANLNFTWRLIRTPQAAIDYVIIHELAHLTHRNHSRAFWARVREMMPEFEEGKKLLRN